MESDFGQTAFNRLFQVLEPDAPSIEEGFRRCRFKLAKFFVWRYCDDPDNLADETISRLLKNARAGQEISADHVYAVAVNVFREYARASKKSGALTNLDDLRERAAAVVVDDCKRHCLAQLSPERRELLARYYLDDEGREEIAQEQGLTLNALRLQVHRMKNWLKRCYEDCRKHSVSPRN
jgi:DNA-directed RNA polymerase specialized sigma24 family protein